LGIIIRDTHEEDFPLLIDLYLNEVENHVERARQFANNLIFRMKTIVCVDPEKIIGTISWEKRGGLEDGVVEITALGVSKNQQRKGIATQLMDHLIGEAQAFYHKEGYKLRILYLFMEKNNTRGCYFYGKSGFQQVCILKGFFPQDDAMIWIRYM
jgi:ribosomal protein S18 acetylase RimI-like enzyme